jgi:quinoprotein glucose dehydrogenase
MQIIPKVITLLAATAAFVAILTPAAAQQWPYYGASAGNTKYSALDQINKENVGKLEIAWEYDTGDWSDGSEHPSRSAFEATPLVIDGVMYLTTPFHRLLALDAETGKLRWAFDPKYDRTQRVNLFVNRGVAYWSGSRKKRLLHGTQKGMLYSIDAETGKLDPEFGDNGAIDLAKDMVGRYTELSYGLTSPVAVCGGILIAGGWVSDGEPQGPSGDIRGFDIRTGKQLWTFHTVPRPGEFGHDTWEGESWKDRGGTNAWSVMSVDEERGMVFAPLTSPSIDFYGGDRKGDNLFSDAVVALDCKTGERKWHFQTIHHDLWDWDLPSHPSLVTVKRNGEDVPAVVQVAKTGFIFVLDRETGKPLFEVEERPVPQSDIPGEQSSPTQPHPVKPPTVARQSMTRDEITDVTPESRAECLEMVKDAVIEGPLFRPIQRKLTVMFPGTNGGPNWGGGSFDPESGVLYVNSMDAGAFTQMIERPGGNPPWRSRSTKWGRFWDSNQYPCQKPPWGTLTAVDLNSGEFRWQSVLGEFDELTARGIPKTGTPNLGGSIVTKGGLVFIAATNDRRFRAFDKDTGQELWTKRLPASGHATPMTYQGKDGKQYIAIAAGGGNKYNDNYMARLIVFALPAE